MSSEDNFGLKLKYFRAKHDLTQTDLSKIIGISQKQISDYEVGTSKPRKTTFFKILDAFNLTADEWEIATTSLPNVDDADPDQFFSYENYSPIAINDQLLEKIGCKKSDLMINFPQTNIMEPTILETDAVLINREKKSYIDGNIYWLYLIQSNTNIYARVFKQQDGILLLKFDNPECEELLVNSSNVFYAGEVVYRQGVLNQPRKIKKNYTPEEKAEFHKNRNKMLEEQDEEMHKK